MSMREYGIKGFGITKRHLKLNYKKIEKKVGHKVTEDDFYDTEIFEEMLGNTPIETIWNDYDFYLLINDCPPWEHNWHEDLKNIKNKDDAINYFWENFKNFVDNTEEDFKSHLEFIDDTYCG